MKLIIYFGNLQENPLISSYEFTGRRSYAGDEATSLELLRNKMRASHGRGVLHNFMEIYWFQFVWWCQWVSQKNISNANNITILPIVAFLHGDGHNNTVSWYRNMTYNRYYKKCANALPPFRPQTGWLIFLSQFCYLILTSVYSHLYSTRWYDVNIKSTWSQMY